MIDTKLIALLNDRPVFEEHIDSIRSFKLRKEPAQIIDDISLFYKHHPEAVSFSWPEFRDYLHIMMHPTWEVEEHERYDMILDKVGTEPEDKSILLRLKELLLVENLKEKVGELEGEAHTLAVSEIEEVLEDFRKQTREKESSFIEMDVGKMVDTVLVGHGIEWRLEDLNLSVGQLHEGDFIQIVKRPETGGTTFLTSEFTYMLDQLPEGKDAIIFNNEEDGQRIGLRTVMSALGMTSPQIMQDVNDTTQRYESFLKGKKISVYDKPGLTTYDIRRVLKENPNYWLVGINVLQKVGGYNKLDGIQRFQKLSEFGRNLAKDGHAVMAVIQADGTAEGTQYMNQNQIHGSKTDVQGEADVMIMIGKDPEQPSLRYFSIAKNKKPTTGRMLPSLKHARFPCVFQEEEGRFVSGGTE